jgi:hypothetical protein
MVTYCFDEHSTFLCIERHLWLGVHDNLDPEKLGMLVPNAALMQTNLNNNNNNNNNNTSNNNSNNNVNTLNNNNNTQQQSVNNNTTSTTATSSSTTSTSTSTTSAWSELEPTLADDIKRRFQLMFLEAVFRS